MLFVLNMAPTDQDTEVVPPAEVPEDLPLPSDPKTIFLGGLFVLALLATAYVVSEIVLPLVFATVLKLLLQPALRALERLHIPRILAALLLILTLIGMIVGLGTAISGPARTWAAKLPEGIPRLEERLSFLQVPINTLQLFLQQVEDIGGTGSSPNGAISERGATLLMKLFTGTQNFASGLFTTLLFLFFLLVSGDIFLHRLVEILPRFSNKRQVVEISQQIESDVSAYLVTITIMNAAVGIATALWSSSCTGSCSERPRSPDGSGVNREVHAPFCERPGVKLLRPTHPSTNTAWCGFEAAAGAAFD